jgi:hypothetical protein
VTRRAAVARLFPAALLIVVLANVLLGVQYHRAAPEKSAYRLARHPVSKTEGTLAAAAAGRHETFIRLWRPFFRLQLALGGARLVAPGALDLDPARWRLLALVDIRSREGERESVPVSTALAGTLRRRSRTPVVVEGRRFFVASELRPPWDEPLHLLAARDSRDLFVVSQAQLAELPSRYR